MKVSKFIFSALVFALVATSAFAQTKADAITAYNAGRESAQAGNYEEAISNFTQALTIADQIGAEGTDIKQRSSKQIPSMYYQIALGHYKTFQKSKEVADIDEAIAAFLKTSEAAEEYGQEQIGQRSAGIVTQLYYNKSVVLYSNGDLDGADTAVDKAINANSNYAKAYYHKAKIHKKRNDSNEDGIIDQNIDALLRWYDQALMTAEKTNDGQLIRTTNNAAHAEMLAVGVKASESKRLDDAVTYLTAALRYNPESADAHFRMAEVYNKMNQPQKAIEHSNKALEFENGGKTDKAKIYFELGFANQKLNNKSAACDAFSNALYGSFKSPAEHKMEFELKCDSASPQN